MDIWHVTFFIQGDLKFYKLNPCGRKCSKPRGYNFI